MPFDPEKNMNAAEDFMLLLTHTHVVAAARYLHLKNPSFSVKELAKSVTDHFVYFAQHVLRSFNGLRGFCEFVCYLNAFSRLVMEWLV